MSERRNRKSYLVECYWPAVDERKARATAERTREAAGELRRRGGDVRFLGSILVPADETVFYLFDGEEADVRSASEQAGVPFERVLESIRVDGGQAEEEMR